jgi:hypothetical protein
MASVALASNDTNTTASSSDTSSSTTDANATNGNTASSSSTTTNNATTTTTTTTVSSNATTTTTTTTVSSNATTTTTTTTGAGNGATTTTTVSSGGETGGDSLSGGNSSNETTGASTQVKQAGLSLAQTLDIPDTVKNVCTNYLGMAQIFTFASKQYMGDTTGTTANMISGGLPNCNDAGGLPGTMQCLRHSYTDDINPHTANFDAWSISKGYDTVSTGCTSTTIARALSAKSKRRMTSTTLTRGDDIAIVYAQNGASPPAAIATIETALTTEAAKTPAQIATTLAAKVSTVTTAFASGSTTGIAIPKSVGTGGTAVTSTLSAIVTGNADPTTSTGTLPPVASSFAANATITVTQIGQLSGTAGGTTSTTSGSVSNGVATAVLAAVAGATMVMAF